MSIAIKTDQKLWDKIKEEKIKENNGKWSARLAQQITREYKSQMEKKGKPPFIGTHKNNSLKKWTEQEWQYVNGGQRYLPKKVIEKLTEEEKRLTNKSKKEGTKRGKQFVPQPQSIRKKINTLIKKA